MEKSSTNDSPDDESSRNNKGINKPAINLLVKLFMQ